MVYLHNLESDRLELHLTKEEYQKLTPEQRGKLRSAYLWSETRRAWVSRSWYNNAWAALTLAVELGAENGGEIGGDGHGQGAAASGGDDEAGA